MSIINKLAKALPMVRQLDAELRDELKRIRDDASALNTERSALLASGLSKEDYLATVLVDIDRVADAELDRYAAFASRLASSSLRLESMRPIVERALSVGNRDSEYPVYELDRLLNRSHEVAFTHFDSRQMMMFFREPIKQTVRAIFDRIEEWPTNATHTAEQAMDRLAAIEVELRRLKEEERALIEQARQVGVIVE